MSDTPVALLVVEDDTDVRETVLECLAEDGIRAEGAADGEAALAWLRSSSDRPAAILLDLMMPRMNGRQFRRAQLNDPELADIPIVVVSADPQIRSIATSLGAAAFLEKPLTLDALRAVARRFSPR